MKKTLALLLVVTAAVAVGLQSCGHPFACITTDIDEDSIHVNQPVTFTGACSSSADDYFWIFDDNSDSSFFGYNITKTFTDTGDHEVFLLVTGKGKSASTTQYYHVNW